MHLGLEGDSDAIDIVPGILRASGTTQTNGLPFSATIASLSTMSIAFSHPSVLIPALDSSGISFSVRENATQVLLAYSMDACIDSTHISSPQTLDVHAISVSISPIESQLSTPTHASDALASSSSALVSFSALTNSSFKRPSPLDTRRYL
ncbi:hypothetical protein L7F22_027428 [Adiantum nelumboides]|nr:hypothetical protein [Adiantum nelumboides]